jgi:hypothetical protein
MSPRCTAVIVYTLKSPSDPLWVGRTFAVDDEGGTSAFVEECRKNNLLVVLVRREVTKTHEHHTDTSWRDATGTPLITRCGLAPGEWS